MLWRWVSAARVHLPKRQCCCSLTKSVCSSRDAVFFPNCLLPYYCFQHRVKIASESVSTKTKARFTCTYVCYLGYVGKKVRIAFDCTVYGFL